MKKLWVMSLVLLLASCSGEIVTEKPITNLQNETLDAAIEIIAKMREAHGVKNIDGKEITFSFRDKVYSRYSFNNQYGYSRSALNEEGKMVIDSWRGDDFKRTINNVEVQITDKEENTYKNSINSVFYFALLPLSLSDPAVNVELLGDSKLKGKKYTKFRVTFDEEGGGEDFNDVFIYWMNKETNTMDFLAYQYFTEGGGIRFREAYNPREVGGFLFQDYNNFKPTTGIELIDMDKAFEMGEMEQVSEIVLEDIKVN
jgi:hypothetical protein